MSDELASVPTTASVTEPRSPAPQRGHRVHPVAHRGEQRLGVGQERPPGVGEHAAAPRALEQRRAELLLEQVHAAADRRLGEAERARRAREAAAPHDRHERLDVIELHRV